MYEELYGFYRVNPIELKIEAMEEKYDRQFRVVFDAIKQMLSEEKKPKQKIGF